MDADLLPLAESESYSCGMPKPITPARPEWEIFKALMLCKGLLLERAEAGASAYAFYMDRERRLNYDGQQKKGG